MSRFDLMEQRPESKTKRMFRPVHQVAALVKRLAYFGSSSPFGGTHWDKVCHMTASCLINMHAFFIGVTVLHARIIGANVLLADVLPETQVKAPKRPQSSDSN